MEGPTVHAQSLGCGSHVAARHFQHTQDVAALELGERQVSLVRDRRRWLAEVEVLGQVVDADHRPWREYQEPLDRIRQLANIPGPCVTLEDPHRLWSDPLLAKPTTLLQRQEVRDDAGDIVRAFTQRR